MAVLRRVVKATTRKGKKVLIKREPQVIEGPKKALFLYGRKTSEKLRSLTKDLFAIKKPDAQMLNRKNDVTIFENVIPVENLCKKFTSSLFVMSSHSKKRPDNLVIGRIFNDSLLDMIELHVENYEGLRQFACSKVVLGTKPLLIFNGPEWEETDELKHLKSLLIDLFNREQTDSVRLQGLEHSISFTVSPEKKILIRSYKLLMKKSGREVPRIELEEMGPRIDLTLRRCKLPSEDLMKEAMRHPKELNVKKKKNITTDDLGNTHGRIHLGKQEIHKVQTRKMKGLRKSVREKKMESAARRALVDSNNVNIVKKQNMGS